MKTSLQIHQFACLKDNYGYLLHDPSCGETIVIDTPDGQACLNEADRLGWKITGIWNTHWHPDHTGGNLQIREATGCRITGPAGEAGRIPGIDRKVAGGDSLEFGTTNARVIDVGGHTLGHIAFHFPEQEIAFVGDAVFALGCGRVFEGSMEMMWESLCRIKALSPTTLLYCAHEYTASNAEFALSVDPVNPVLRDYVSWVRARRAEGLPTVPALLERELAANPFLRADVPGLQEAMGYPGDAAATFGELRRRKDRF